MKFKIAAVVALALAGAPEFASAHHSFAAFDNSKTITVSGTVREFQWTNPHSWIQIMVNGPSGASEEWSIEGGSPNQLSRQGWRKISLVPGQRVSVKLHPMKNGTKGGSLMNVTFADGRVLGGPGGPPGGGPGGPPGGPPGGGPPNGGPPGGPPRP